MISHSETHLFQHDACAFDHGRPLDYLAANKVSKGLARPTLRLESETDEALLVAGIHKNGIDVTVELLDDSRRRAGRCEQAEPPIAQDRRITEFGKGLGARIDL